MLTASHPSGYFLISTACIGARCEGKTGETGFAAVTRRQYFLKYRRR
jgi:hypothetical protein